MKRNYKADLDYVESGFRACWRNAIDLVQSARLLMDAKQIGVPLSLSVLAMEEVGKMMLLDTLLFSKPNDYKDQQFRSGFYLHHNKLAKLEGFPLFLGALATADPRYTRERAYKQEIAVRQDNLKRDRCKLAALLNQGCDLTVLDKWKQRGFYASPEGNRLITPNQIVPEVLARAVYTLAWQITSSLDFVLKNENIDRYFARVRDLRSKLSETDHQLFERLGRQIANEIFERDGEDNESETETKRPKGE